MDLPFDLLISHLGIYLREPQTLNISTPMFIAASFTTTKIWKQPQCPSVDYWIKNQWHIYIREYNYAIKKKKKQKLYTLDSMDGPGEHYAK